MISTARRLIGSWSSNVLLVAGDEGEMLNVPVEFGQRKLDACNATAVEERQLSLLFRLQVVQGDAGEVGNDHVARNFVLRGLRG